MELCEHRIVSETLRYVTISHARLVAHAGPCAPHATIPQPCQYEKARRLKTAENRPCGYLRPVRQSQVSASAQSRSVPNYQLQSYKLRLQEVAIRKRQGLPVARPFPAPCGDRAQRDKTGKCAEYRVRHYSISSRMRSANCSNS